MAELNNNEVIYLIKQIWTSELENRKDEALGYKTIGFVRTLEEAQAWEDSGRDYTVNDCWAIKGSLTEYTFEQVIELKTE